VHEADAASIASCFVVDAVHYHPSVAKWEGAATIGDNMVKLVRERGLCWTVNQLVVDAGRSAAAIEWTGTDRVGRVLREVDWFIFEPGAARIAEIRVYLAARPDPDRQRQELMDFDYSGRGYPIPFQ